MIPIKKILHILILLFLTACITAEFESEHIPVDFNLQTPENMNLELMAEMESFIGSGKYGKIYSILVLKDKQCVYEKYFNEVDPDSLIPLYEATSFITSSLIGIAYDNGLIESQDVSIIDFFPDLTFNNSLMGISLHHTLSHSSGLTPLSNWENQENAYSIVLNSEISSIPGELYEDNPGVSFLNNKIINQATNSRIDSFAAKHLFEPLNITNWNWDEDQYNRIRTDGSDEGLSMTTRDFAKIGLMYLNNGKWNKKQVLSNYWVNETMKPWMYMSYNFHQGYCCRVMNKNTTIPKLYETKVVNVNGLSQNMWLLKDLNTVVVVTADKTASRDKLPEFLTHYMLPALNPENILKINSNYAYYAKALDSIVIDGSLNEWINHETIEPSNPQLTRNTISLIDYQPKIQVGWSKFRPTKIFIAVEIIDDILIDHQSNIELNDRIEISLDLSNTGKTYKWGFNTNGTFYGDVANNSNTIYTINKTDNSYQIEIEIDPWLGRPLEYDLKNFFIEREKHIGIKINCYDVDNIGELATLIGWSTDDKEDFLFNDYKRPALFGSIIFIE